MIKLTKKLENRMRIQLNKFQKYSSDRLPDVDTNKIHQHPHGHMEITNRFAAIRVSDVLDGSTYNENHLFPDMNHIFEAPKNDVIAVTIPVKEIEDKINPKNIKDSQNMRTSKITVQQSTLRIQPLNTIVGDDGYDFDEILIDIPETLTKERSFMLSPTYLYDAMTFFRMLGIKEVTLLIQTDHKPIRLLSENIHYVIAQMIKEKK